MLEYPRLQIVGWGCGENEHCDFCKKEIACCYVDDDPPTYEMRPCCNSCAKFLIAHGIIVRDSIADIFKRVKL